MVMGGGRRTQFRNKQDGLWVHSQIRSHLEGACFRSLPQKKKFFLRYLGNSFEIEGYCPISDRSFSSNPLPYLVLRLALCSHFAHSNSLTREEAVEC